MATFKRYNQTRQNDKSTISFSKTGGTIGGASSPEPQNLLVLGRHDESPVTHPSRTRDKKTGSGILPEPVRYHNEHTLADQCPSPSGSRKAASDPWKDPPRATCTTMY